ncbi:MAG: hypothetical protein K2J67_09420 [Lachnospiraceae bacterium]|nr:hypothetical protein [Lachnospiraceae bacterium]
MSDRSVFSQTELPTWSEIYDDYYTKMFLKRDNVYDPDDGSYPNDPYWKVPRRKVLIALVCNQFNKMIYEDNYKDPLIKLINQTYTKDVFTGSAVVFDVRFSATVIPDMGKGYQVLGAEEWDNFERARFSNPEALSFIAGTDFHIYSFTNPNGHEDPFVTNHTRLNIDKINSLMCVFPMVKISANDNDRVRYSVNEILPFNRMTRVADERNI